MCYSIFSVDLLIIGIYYLLITDDYHGKPSGTGFHLTQPDKDREYNDAKITYEPRKNLDFTSWEDVLENCTPGVEYVQYSQPFSLKQHDTMGQLFDNSFLKKQEFEDQSPSQEELQVMECLPCLAFLDNFKENSLITAIRVISACNRSFPITLCDVQ